MHYALRKICVNLLFINNHGRILRWSVVVCNAVYIDDNYIISSSSFFKPLYSTAGIASWTLSGCICCLICCFLHELLLNSNNKLNSFATFLSWVEIWVTNWPLKFWVDSSRVEWHFGFHAMVFTLSQLKSASWTDSNFLNYSGRT